MSAEQQFNDRLYFIRRAQQERAVAASSEDNAVALAHLRMADEYDRRARAMVVPLTVVG